MLWFQFLNIIVFLSIIVFAANSLNILKTDFGGIVFLAIMFHAMISAVCSVWIMFRVVNAIIGGAGMIGYAFAFTGDMNKAFTAAARVFKLLDR